MLELQAHLLDAEASDLSSPCFEGPSFHERATRGAQRRPVPVLGGHTVEDNRQRLRVAGRHDPSALTRAADHGAGGPYVGRKDRQPVRERIQPCLAEALRERGLHAERRPGRGLPTGPPGRADPQT